MLLWFDVKQQSPLALLVAQIKKHAVHEAMNGENRQLVTDEPVEFEK